MIDYTPTTEQVRKDYAYEEWLDKPVQEHLKAFDRWYAEEIRKAKEEAWLEGYSDCMDFHMSNGLKGTEANPYKEQK